MKQEIEHSLTTESPVLQIAGFSPHALWNYVEKNGWEALGDKKVVVVKGLTNKMYLLVDPEMISRAKAGEFLAGEDQTVIKRGGDIPVFNKVFGENATLLNASDPDFWKQHREAMNKVLSAISPEGLVLATQTLIEKFKTKENGQTLTLDHLEKYLSEWTHHGLGGQVIRADLGNPEQMIREQEGVNKDVVVALLTQGLINSKKHRDAVKEHLRLHLGDEELTQTMDVLKRIVSKRESLASGDSTTIMDEASNLFMRASEVAGIASTDTTLSAALFTTGKLGELEASDPEYFSTMMAEVHDFFGNMDLTGSAQEQAKKMGTAILRGCPPRVQAFVLESLRCARVVQYSPVEAANDIQIQEGSAAVIPAGSTVYPMYSVISENPLHWPGGHAGFDPEYFLRNDLLNPHAMTTPDYLLGTKHLPYYVFGAPERDCSGSVKATLALNTLVLLFARDILSTYRAEDVNIKRMVVTGLTISSLLGGSKMTLQGR